MTSFVQKHNDENGKRTWTIDSNCSWTLASTNEFNALKKTVLRGRDM